MGRIKKCNVYKGATAAFFSFLSCRLSLPIQTSVFFLRSPKHTYTMFTEAFLDIQEILDRNYQIEKEWRDFFFKPSIIYPAIPKIKNTSSL